MLMHLIFKLFLIAILSGLKIVSEVSYFFKIPQVLPQLHWRLAKYQTSLNTRVADPVTLL